MQELKYDHIGIPTCSQKNGMIYYPEWKVWTSDYEKNPYRIEWVFFEKESPLHPIIQTIPHVCFIVKDIKRMMEGKKVLLPVTYYQNYYMAFIEDDGAPVEFLQSSC